MAPRARPALCPPQELAKVGINDYRVVTFGQPPVVSWPSLEFLKVPPTPALRLFAAARFFGAPFRFSVARRRSLASINIRAIGVVVVNDTHAALQPQR